MINLLSKLMGLGLMATSFSAFAQAPANWFNLDLNEDKVHGVSTEKAYRELLANKKPKKTVLVAVIDSGIDFEHEDLKEIMWVNPKEIPGNGIDDDGNGYIDDVHGWNFIGGKEGKNINDETLELTRLYRQLSDKTKRNKKEEAFFIKLKDELESKTAQMKMGKASYQMIYESIETLEKHFGNSDFKAYDIKSIPEGANEAVKKAAGLFSQIGAQMPDQTGGEVKEYMKDVLNYFNSQIDYNLNPDFDPRNIVGDDYSNQTEKFYGNADCYGPEAEHGTHVAGIIGAVRGNGIGMDGVSGNVRIMSIRAVPNGDERDKDIANSIRYAVDNGAEIVNMSFGKSYSYNKKIVDDAVKYAEKKGVLLVHAAGNDSKHIDVEYNFPSKFYQGGKDAYKRGKKSAKNWIEVGALSWKDGADAPAVFSNYGKNTVDLFAPGVDINSTIPESKYKPNSGTSMAAPVVAGVAALVKSYYPELNAAELKICLKKSVTPITTLVNKPGNKSKVDFKELSITGGVVNVYSALKLADEMVAKKSK